MPDAMFRYEVADSSGKVLSGVMAAPDEQTVTTRLSQQGFRVLQVIPRASGHGPHVQRTGASVRTRRVGPSDRALFFRQLASLVRAGISPFAALSDLSPRLGNPTLREASASMCAGAHAGQNLWSAMEQYPSLFAPHVVATVRAGETGGFLDIALDEIALEAEEETAFYKGMWLPKVLILQQVIALAIAQPLFPTLFPNNEPVRYLGLVFLRNIPIAVAVAAIVRWIWFRLHAPKAAHIRDRWTLRVPIFGDLARQRSLAAFIRMLRRLYAAGLMPMNAWEGATQVVPNMVIRARLEDAQAMMQKGVPLHDAFRATGLFANEAEQLIATGVASGEVVEMLDRVADYYQNNVQRAFDASRFWMYRLAFAFFLAVSGVVVAMMAKTYFDAVFNFTKDWV